MEKRLFLMGGGGHAKVVIEVARDQGYSVEACLAMENVGSSILDVPILAESHANLSDLARRGIEGFVAVGSNKLRQKLSDLLGNYSIRQPTLIASNAFVSPSAILGAGTIVMPSATVCADAIIGAGVILNTGCSADHECVISDYCHLGPGCRIAGKVRIGHATFLGIGCCVIPDLVIGCNVTIGAGAVVVKSVPDDQVWCGVPARHLTRLSR